jgi:nudix-type nucleoside diphosphatase (YffH/AdpP family)
MMHHDRRVEIRGRHRLLNDFFKVDEVTVAHQRYDGTMSAGERRLVLERGDAIAVLLFDKQTRSVLAVEQFRLPALIARRRDNPTTSDGWITELVAGMIDEGESATQAVVRETFEETGYRIENPKPIGTYFSSPGGSSERFFLYCALVSAARREGRGGGLAGEEDIKVFQIDVEDLFDQLAAGTIEDPKLAIAGYWLKDNIDRL